MERVAEAQQWLDIPAFLKMAWWREKPFSYLWWNGTSLSLILLAFAPQSTVFNGQSLHVPLYFSVVTCCLPLPWTFSLSYRAAIHDFTDCALQKYHSYYMRWFDKSSLRNLSTSLPLNSHYSHSLTNVWKSIKCQVFLWVLRMWHWTR